MPLMEVPQWCLASTWHLREAKIVPDSGLDDTVLSSRQLDGSAVESALEVTERRLGVPISQVG